MPGRLEQWKAREKIRADIGWMAVWVGLGGLYMLVASIAVVGGVDGAHGSAWVGLPLGSALLACALGLWNAKSWARWVVVVIAHGVVFREVISLQLDLLLPFFLFTLVYLMLPSTSRRFARAQSAQRCP